MNFQQWATLPATRREFLARSGTGLGTMGLASLMNGAANAEAVASRGVSPMLSKPSHYTAKAKHVIHIFLNGGPSHVDTFDPKPSPVSYTHLTLPTTPYV